MKERGTIFRQSLRDFPCPVVLGHNTPSFGLHRYKEGLRFIPPDDEGFILRGDKRQLVYKGRRRSHRFTVLGDKAFEYDYILLKEPESNVVSLRMEGAGNYDFFRQPDFLKNPLLAGSYAVYKKETLIGEGTGKLCHIHRPEIIDNRGRRCWGDLAVVGNELRITIPEKWLGEAAYPVIVDPVVGTTTYGRQTEWPDEEFGDYLCFCWDIAVNRYLVPETISGYCTAYAYTNEGDNYEGGYGAVYADNGNKPKNKISCNEEWFDLNFWHDDWGHEAFELSNPITSGSYVWFGILGNDCWWPAFDYGSRCYFTQDFSYAYPPDPFPTPNYNLDMKLSMYFSYNDGRNYIHTLTQGVTLTDNWKPAIDFSRVIRQTVQGSAIACKCQIFLRQCVMNAANTMSIERIQGFVRAAVEGVGIGGKIANGRTLLRNCAEAVTANGGIEHLRGLVREIREMLTGKDGFSFQAVYIRSMREKSGALDFMRHWRGFLRVVRDVSGSIAEADRIGEFYRFHGDGVHAEGNALRELFIRIKVCSSLVVREFILGRLLSARKEIVLKSCINNGGK